MCRLLFLLAVVCLGCRTVYSISVDDLPSEVRQMLKNLHDNCVDETGVSESLIKACNKGEFANDKNLKCYMKCLMTSIGVMEEDGTMDWDTYIGLLPEFLKGYGKKVIGECSRIKSNGDGCETAFLLNKCCYESDPIMYMLY